MTGKNKNFFDIKYLIKLKKIKLIESEILNNSNYYENIQNLFFNISNESEKTTQEFLVEFEEFFRLWNSNAIPSETKNKLKNNITIPDGKIPVIEFQKGNFGLPDKDAFLKKINNPIKTLCIASLFTDISNQITSIHPSNDNEDYEKNIANVIKLYIEPSSSNFSKVKFINLSNCMDINDAEIILKLSKFPSLETLRIDGITSNKQNSSIELAKLDEAFNSNKSNFFNSLKQINIGGKVSPDEAKQIILFLYKNIPTLENIISNNLSLHTMKINSIFVEINEYNKENNITKKIKINNEFEEDYQKSEFTTLYLDNESVNVLQHYNKGVSIKNIELDPDIESDIIIDLIDLIKSKHIIGVESIKGDNLKNLTIEDVKEIKDTLKNIELNITLRNVNPVVYNAIINRYVQFNHKNIEDFIDDMSDAFDQIEGQNKISIDLSQLTQHRIDVNGVYILKDMFEERADNIAAIMLPDKIFIRIDSLKSAFRELIELLKSKHIAVHPDSY